MCSWFTGVVVQHLSNNPILEREDLKDEGNCLRIRVAAMSSSTLTLCSGHPASSSSLLLSPLSGLTHVWLGLSCWLLQSQVLWKQHKEDGWENGWVSRCILSPCSADLAGESWKSLNIWILNLGHLLHLVVKSSAKKNYQRKIDLPIKWGYTCWVWAPSIYSVIVTVRDSKNLKEATLSFHPLTLLLSWVWALSMQKHSGLGSGAAAMMWGKYPWITYYNPSTQESNQGRIITWKPTF